MSFIPLICYSPCPFVQSLSVKALWSQDGSLQLHYVLDADLMALRLPEKQMPSFADGLWQHTCFELFVTTPDHEGYQEFNFSPSLQWAAYQFSRYRKRADWQPQHQYAIQTLQDGNRLHLEVNIPLIDLPLIADSNRLQLGLTAVLEDCHGQLTYWALEHPRPNPDFHDRAGFIYTLNQE